MHESSGDPVNVVDAEIRLRMEAGMKAKLGIEGDEDEYEALLKMARLAGCDPLVHTYLEVEAAVRKLYEDYYGRVKALNIVRRRIE